MFLLYNILCNDILSGGFCVNLFKKICKIRINEDEIYDVKLNKLIDSAKKEGYSKIIIEFDEKTHFEQIAESSETELVHQSLTCVINTENDYQTSSTVPVNFNGCEQGPCTEYIAYINDISGNTVSRIYRFPFSSEKIPGVIFEEGSAQNYFSCLISNISVQRLLVEDEPVNIGQKASLFSGCSFSAEKSEYIFYTNI